MQEQELRDLRRELAAQRGPGVYYPERLRERATRWARQQLAAGATAGAVATSLGIGRDTLRRWMATAATTALVPVEIVDEPSAAQVTVVSPNGFRISGLTLDDAIVVLRRLG
jgi:DNA-binding transcriptional regulator LsrR (DeoR family)